MGYHFESTRRGSPRRNAAAAAGVRERAAASTVVVVLQSVVCLLLLTAVFTLRFINTEDYAVLGNYYKAVMLEEGGDTVSVGVFGKPIRLSDLQDYASAARWRRTVTDNAAAIGASTARGDLYLGPIAVTAKAVPPVTGTVSSLFAVREDPFTGQIEFHNGLDIAAPQGSDICAVLPGTVKEVGWSQWYGNYIKIAHADGFETWYNHCSEILAREGAEIRAGERIALVGSTGNSTGSHLHLTLYLNGRYADPLALYL